MNEIPLLNQGLLPTEVLTREKVRARARAIAMRDGRSPVEVSQNDYEQAKRELTGLSDFAQQEAMLDLLSQIARAKSAAGSGKGQIPPPPVSSSRSAS